MQEHPGQYLVTLVRSRNLILLLDLVLAVLQYLMEIELTLQGPELVVNQYLPEDRKVRQG